MILRQDKLYHRSRPVRLRRITPPIFIFKEQCHIQMAKVEKIHPCTNRLPWAKLNKQPKTGYIDGHFAKTGLSGGSFAKPDVMRLNYPNFIQFGSKWPIDNIATIRYLNPTPV